MKKYLLILLLGLALPWQVIYGQIAINNDGNPPDNSAILDLQSPDKGLLLPRIDFNDRPDPAAAGLLIFVTANGPLGDNALYFYDGTRWLKLANVNNGIGEQKEGGIVFWLDETGEHGLVSAMDDQYNTDWGCAGTLIGPDAQHTDIGTGDLNTAAIIALCTDDWIAAYSCDNLTLNGYSDWYLPSINELSEMYAQRAAIGGFGNVWFWSSTEAADAAVPAEAAWTFMFDYGFAGWTSKSSSLHVRCIRKF
jgi:hypothetical protein